MVPVYPTGCLGVSPSYPAYPTGCLGVSPAYPVYPSVTPSCPSCTTGVVYPPITGTGGTVTPPTTGGVTPPITGGKTNTPPITGGKM